MISARIFNEVKHARMWKAPACRQLFVVQHFRQYKPLFETGFLQNCNSNWVNGIIRKAWNLSTYRAKSKTFHSIGCKKHWSRYWQKITSIRYLPARVRHLRPSKYFPSAQKQTPALLHLASWSSKRDFWIDAASVLLWQGVMTCKWSKSSFLEKKMNTVRCVEFRK